jgi:HSP20 family protein
MEMALLPARRSRGRYLTPFDLFGEDMRRFLGLSDEDYGNQLDWFPAVDISETTESIEVCSELPGMKKEDIEIEVAKGVLTIRGEKKEEEERSERSYHHREVRYGSFSRSFSLPADVKADEAKADFRDGVLTITLPKEEKALHRKIEIK